IEAAHHEATEDVEPPSDHEVGAIRAEQVRSDAERGGSRGAGGGDGQQRPAGADPARERAARAVVERRAGLSRTAVLVERTLQLLDAAERGTDDDREAGGLGVESRAAPQIVRGGEQELRGAACDAPTPVDRRHALDLAPTSHAEVVDAKP